MSTPYIGEIRMFAGNFAPNGWAFCDGSVLPISENDTLFNLLGTTYGGDGETWFALPDLRGRVPIHQSASHPLAEQGGTETVTLTTQHLPAHSHEVPATTQRAAPAHAQSGTGVFASTGATPLYAAAGGGSQVQLANDVLVPTGGSQPHNNMAPYLGINFIISLYGIFPSPT